MKRSEKSLLLLFFLFGIFFSVSVFAAADSGPKPSVRIFLGEEHKGAYATLLSERPSTGPHSAWDGSEENAYHALSGYGNTPYEVWEALTSYEDTDGFYFLQTTEQRVDGAGEYIWGYYPPERFKLLLYFPESETFLVSGEIYERYAFHSYFSAFDDQNGNLWMFSTYDYTSEIVGFLARVGITLFAELLLALIFFRKERRMLVAIGILNLVTQILLNLSLVKTGYLNGAQVLVLRYISLEFFVFLGEGAVLSLLAPRFTEKTRSRLRAWTYAALANLSSLLLGLGVSELLPSLF